jgi:rSAM/selenodomain-associated transferase 2
VLPPTRISVIVPVLNEAARIGAQLAHLKQLPGVHEVIVVDGGSTDQTCEVVRAAGWPHLLVSAHGRAMQMNTGARLATGDVLLFLHADVTLPDDVALVVEHALADPRVVAGAFRTHTVADDQPSWVRRWLRLADLRSRYSRLPYGDQALFVRQAIFEQLGGFPAQPLFEDLEISRRLRKIGRIRTVPAAVRVSGRRFVARPFYYATLMNVLPVLYRLGVPAARLASAYGDVR